MDQPYFYVAVRKDIPVADQVCQVAHACANAGESFPVIGGCFLVLLQVKDKSELIKMSEQLRGEDIQHYLNHEPDDDMGFTALATSSVMGEKRRVFRKYRLWH